MSDNSHGASLTHILQPFQATQPQISPVRTELLKLEEECNGNIEEMMDRMQLSFLKSLTHGSLKELGLGSVVRGTLLDTPEASYAAGRMRESVSDSFVKLQWRSLEMLTTDDPELLNQFRGDIPYGLRTDTIWRMNRHQPVENLKEMQEASIVRTIEKRFVPQKDPLLWNPSHSLSFTSASEATTWGDEYRLNTGALATPISNLPLLKLLLGESSYTLAHFFKSNRYLSRNFMMQVINEYAGSQHEDSLPTAVINNLHLFEDPAEFLSAYWYVLEQLYMLGKDSKDAHGMLMKSSPHSAGTLLAHLMPETEGVAEQYAVELLEDAIFDNGDAVLHLYDAAAEAVSKLPSGSAT